MSALHLTPRCTPIPDGKGKCGTGGVSQVFHPLICQGTGWCSYLPDSIDCELVGIDAVEIIEAKRWQKTVPGHRDFLVCDFQRCQRRSELRILFSSLRLGFLKRGQRFNILQIVYGSEVLVKIRKNNN